MGAVVRVRSINNVVELLYVSMMRGPPDIEEFLHVGEFVGARSTICCRAR